MRGGRLSWRTSVLLIVFLQCLPLYALTDEEIFREFRFNLINPGARSLAMGGAFIALADDATAAQANPAGLQLLGDSEYFLELRNVVTTSRSVSLAFGFPGNSLLVETGTDLDDVQSATFASAVVPIRVRDEHRFSLGVSRQEVLHSTSETVDRYLATGGGPNAIETAEVLGSGALDVRQTNYNVSIGYRVPGMQDRLAIGGSLAFSTLRVRADVENTIVGDLFSEAPLETPTLEHPTHIDDSDRDLSFSVGAMFRIAEFQVGAVYRRAPKFSVTEVVEPTGIDLSGVQARLGSRFRNTFHLPDSYGLGVSWQPAKLGSGLFTVALGVERVGSSRVDLQACKLEYSIVSPK